MNDPGYSFCTDCGAPLPDAEPGEGISARDDHIEHLFREIDAAAERGDRDSVRSNAIMVLAAEPGNFDAVEILVREIRDAAEKSDWDTAGGLAAEILRYSPGNPDAAAYAEMASSPARRQRCPGCANWSLKQARCTTCGRVDGEGEVPGDGGSGRDGEGGDSSRRPAQVSTETGPAAAAAGTPYEVQDDAAQHAGRSAEESIAGLEARIDRLYVELMDIRRTLRQTRPYLPGTPARSFLSSGATPRPAQSATPAAPRPSPPLSAVGAAHERETAPGPNWLDQMNFDWRERVNINWELIVGGNWLVRIGVLAVVIGVGFFLALAFENNWINETGRVALGVAAGAVMIGAGEYYYRRYAVFGQALSGGGIGVLYMSIFAGFAAFDLIGVYPALVILIVAAIGAAALAIRYESAALALLGILGAYAAPFIVGGVDDGTIEDPNGIALMVYILAVSAGVLALSTFRNWRWFTLAGLAGGLISYGLWQLTNESANVAVAQGGLTGIFLIFVGATTLFHFVWLRSPQAFDRALMVLNSKAYFGISYLVLWDDYRAWMGGFTFLLALFYGGIGYAAYLRVRQNTPLMLMTLGIALVFFTVAIPVQLDGPTVSVAWGVEAAVLMWLSFRLRMGQLRIASYLAYLAGAAWLLVVDTPDAFDKSLMFVLNQYMPVYLAAVAVPFFMAYLLLRHRDSLRKEEKEIAPTAFLVAGTLF
ncbi:MAG: DUF2339 domain-containing protein, partial [Chloroflexi bacterium]|nr:DUF2339 domain-containing protein [Chloroflexota bacterium]